MVDIASLETDPVKDSVLFYGSLGRQAVSDRLKALDEEADAETVATLGMAGAGALALVFGFLGSRLWRLLAWAALPLIFVHARGRLPGPTDFLKTLGLRTRREIAEEKYALKALRGDFRGVDGGGAEIPADPASALEAVRS